MKFLLSFTALVAVVVAVPNLVDLNSEKWVSFKNTHKKTYGSLEEELKRVGIFNDNLKRIAEHNQQYEAGLSTYKMGITQFADLTKEEFMAYVNKFNMTSLSKSKVNRKPYVRPVGQVAADSVDWRDQGVITNVKDQGSCGSCWSFSATGSLEGQYALATGELVSLSEQNLMDCSQRYGNGDCLNGGLMDWAFDYIIDNGIMREDDYPYVAEITECRFDPEKSVTKINSYVDIDNEDDLRTAVSTVGPISIAIDATANLQMYESGVLIDNACRPYELNHGVLLVGYTDEYYIIKNSWGDYWGEDGYFRLGNIGTNPCGLATEPSYPIIN